MIQKTDKVLGVGKYKTRHGHDAEVFSVVNGEWLVGVWFAGAGDYKCPLPQLWRMDGRVIPGNDHYWDIGFDTPPKVKRTYWLNIYDDGPGLLRSTWEQALIESGCNEKQPLCRVEVKVDSYVGEGLK